MGLQDAAKTQQSNITEVRALGALCRVEWREAQNRRYTAIFWRLFLRLLKQINYLRGRYADSYLQISHEQIRSTNKIVVSLYVHRYIGTKKSSFSAKKEREWSFHRKKRWCEAGHRLL